MRHDNDNGLTEGMNRYERNRRRSAAERVRAEKNRPGQISPEELPMRMHHYGNWFSPFTVDDYIEQDLKHDPCTDGMDVFRFTSEDGKRVYAAIIADTISRATDDIKYWHVELYRKPSDAWNEITRVQKKIDKALAA